MTEVLATVDAELADLAIDTLARYGLVAVDRQLPDGRVALVVRSTDVEQAREVLAHALPELGDEPIRAAGGLSRRLIRSEEPSAEAVVHDPAAEDDYIPPEPPPIPHGDTISRLAWLGAAGGPVLMVAAVLLGLPGAVTAAGLAGFVAGFVALVARMPDRARQDDGWDDGAVV